MNFFGQIIIFFIVLTSSFNVCGKVVQFDKPIREISIIASDEGYYPSHIPIFLGEKVRLFLTSVSTKPSCFYLEKTFLHTGLKMGEIKEFTINFSDPGIYYFHCPTHKIKGRIHVFEKLDPTKEDENEKKVEQDRKKWVPPDDPYFKG